MKKILVTTNLIWYLIVVVIFFGSVSLAQLVRLQIANITIYPHDLIVCLLCFKWFFDNAKSNQKTSTWFNKNLPVWLVLMWIVLGWLIALAQDSLGISAVLTAVRLTAYALAVAQLHSQISNYFPAWLNTGIIFFTAFLMSCWGILQYMFIPDTRFLHIFGWDDHYYRLIGPLLDPNFAGMVSVIALWTWQNLKTEKRVTDLIGQRWQHGVDLVITIISLSALTMTFSRSSWLALVVSIIVSLIFTRPKFRWSVGKNSLLWLALVFVCYLILPKPTGEGVDITRTTSVSARTSLSQQLMYSWKWHDWLFGNGLFNVRPNIDTLGTAELEKIPNTSRQPDNLVIQLVGSLGLGGLLLLIILLRKTDHSFDFSSQAAPLLTAWFVHAQFSNSLFQPQLWILFISYVLTLNQKTSDLST